MDEATDHRVDPEELREEVAVTVALCAESLSLPPEAIDGPALAAAAHLTEAADRTLHLLVARSRAVGRSWAEIGAALGITRQAAQRRFSAAPPQRISRELPEPDPATVELGRRMLDELARGETDLLDRHLGARSRAALGEPGMAGLLTGIRASFGEFVSRETLTARDVGGVVVIRSREERTLQPAAVGLNLAADGTVLGIHYLVATEGTR